MEGGDEPQEVIDVSVSAVLGQDREVADVAIRGCCRRNRDANDGVLLVVRDAPPVAVAGTGR